MKPRTVEDYQERLLGVLVYIQQHLDEPLPLDELARIACFSPYHFHRIFTGMVGEAVAEHVRRLRLERAAMRLKHGHEPVTAIALEAGYETHESFTRAFKAWFGVPPSEYRAHHSLPIPGAVSRVHYSPDGPPTFVPQRTGGATMEVRIVKAKPRRAAFIRHQGPYSQVGETWGRLYGFAGPRGYFPPRAAFFAVVHDDPQVTPPDRLRYDACFEVDDRFRPQGEVGVQEVAGGEYAVAIHTGPYDTLGETYCRLCGEWAPAHGREPRAAPALEFYLDDPRRTPPEKLRTEIHLPLEPA